MGDEEKADDFREDGVDEFFGDDMGEEEARSNTMADRELAAARARLTTLGYQDGVDDGVQEAVQDGFDKGYADGAAAGWETGSMYGAAAALRAAFAASDERPAEAGAAETAHCNTAKGSRSSTSEDEQYSSTATSSASISGVGGAGGARVGSGDAVGAGPTSPLGRRLLDEGENNSAVARAAEVLQGLVEELRHASLLGPDGQGVPDRADVLRRLRLVGPAGAAVADVLDESTHRSRNA